MSEAVLIGASGMLGRAFCQVLENAGVAYTKTNRPEIDLEDASTFRKAVDADARWVINCAAWTSVDAAEEHEEQAIKINGEAVGALAEVCKDVGARLVHFSTDYVFDGKATTPYPIDAPHAPINAYGRSKVLGEELLMKSGADFLMVRTSWLYAAWGNNFVRTMMRLSRERKKLRVVDDQVGRPSNASHVARATYQLMKMGEKGVFHIADGGACTWYGLTKEIARLVNPNCNVEPCRSEDFPRPALRPGYSVLDVSRTEALLGPMPLWQQQVAAVVEVCRDD